MITINATGDTTLHTAGKYCPEDILVKVPAGGSSGGGSEIKCTNVRVAVVDPNEGMPVPDSTITCSYVTLNENGSLQNVVEQVLNSDEEIRLVNNTVLLVHTSVPFSESQYFYEFEIVKWIDNQTLVLSFVTDVVWDTYLNLYV